MDVAEAIRMMEEQVFKLSSKPILTAVVDLAGNKLNTKPKKKIYTGGRNSGKKK